VEDKPKQKRLAKSEETTSNDDGMETLSQSDLELTAGQRRARFKKKSVDVFDQSVSIMPTKKRTVKRVNRSDPKRPKKETSEGVHSAVQNADLSQKENSDIENLQPNTPYEFIGHQIPMSGPADTIQPLIKEQNLQREITPISRSQVTSSLSPLPVSLQRSDLFQKRTNPKRFKSSETKIVLLHSTPIKELPVDFGDVSPIFTDGLICDDHENPLELDQIQPPLVHDKDTMHYTKENAIMDLRAPLSKPGKKRVGRLGLSLQQKEANKLSFDIIKAVSNPTDNPKRVESNSPTKPQHDFEKRDVVMAVRRVNTVTYGRPAISMQVTDSISDAIQIPTHKNLNNTVESDREEDCSFDEGLESSDDEGKPRVRGIHELREAGHSKRSRDDLDYISEGLQSPMLNIRRSTSVEMLKKLQTPQFASNIRIHGYMNKIFNVVRQDTDPILHVTLCYVICSLGNDLRNLESLNKNEFVDWLMETIAQYLKMNVLVELPKKRYEKTLVMEIHGHIQNDLNWGDNHLDTSSHLKRLLLRLVDLEASIVYSSRQPNPILLQHISDDLKVITFPPSFSLNASLAMLEIMVCCPLEQRKAYSEFHLLELLWVAFAKYISRIF
jgi:hypothetical protein